MKNEKYYINFRKEIHQNPELAFNEFDTKKRILEHFDKYNNIKIIEFDDTTFCVILDSNKAGKTILFRTEIDALLIQETNDFKHKSKNEEVSHKCGHDGHLTIITALADKIIDEGIGSGRVIFLYQAAEETGEGGIKLSKNQKFKDIDIDYCFALHNIPGYPKHSIICKEGVFSSASTGMIIKLFGKTSHAAEPENGINPAYAISEIINLSKDLINNDISKDDFTLITPIQIDMGSEAFGTSAGYGEVKFTIRAYKNEIMQELLNKLENEIENITNKYKLKKEIEYKEYFYANENDKYSNDLIKNIANNFQLKIIAKDQPFKWSEDFGAISSMYKGAMFGLGSGEETPALHNPDYDFPDEIIETGVNMFYGIYKDILQT